jgi:hypothetical protein
VLTVCRGISRLVPIAVRSALTPPGTPHTRATPNSSATATSDGASPAAHGTCGHAHNEAKRRPVEGLIQHGRPWSAWRIDAGEKTGIRRSPVQLFAPQAAAEIIGQAQSLRDAHEIAPCARSLGRREGA